MAPKSPWKRPTESASPSIDYGQAQSEELGSLRAIYMEDFEASEVKGAWGKKNVDRSFKLRIRSPSDRDASVVLGVTFTATYPKTTPVLDLGGLAGFHERTQTRLRNIAQRRPKELLGSEMVYTIVSEMEEALEDAVLARQQGTLPSLEDERASAEEVAIGLAKEAEEAEARRLREAQSEEDRVLQQMVDEELNRTRKDRRKHTKTAAEAVDPHSADETSTLLSFDQPAKIQVGNEVETFKEVRILDAIVAHGPDRTFLARPHCQNRSNPPPVVIRRRKVQKERGGIIEIESILDTVRTLRHPNLLTVFAYRVNKIETNGEAPSLTSELITCHEYADRGTLHELLSAFGTFDANKSRQLAIELLEGLDYLHRNGVVHGSLNLHTIYLSSRAASSPKMSNFGYASKLGPQRDDVPNKWKCPLETKPSQIVDRKADIWDFGIVLSQLLLGQGIPEEYSSPAVMLDKLGLSVSLEDILSKAFSQESKKRPSAFDLVPSEFLRTQSTIWEESGPKVPLHHRKSSSGLASPLRHRSRHNSSNIHEPISRYMSDFTELGRLGRGGFGEVVKARNKLDGGIYAVKKIRQTQQLLDHVLSEVILLNRLNHPYVVRYFSTWVERETSESLEEEAISTTNETLSDSLHSTFGFQSTGGLDFVSSSGYPGFEFAEEGNNDTDEDDEDDGNGSDEMSDEDDIFERGDDGDNIQDIGTPLIQDATPPTDNLRLSKSRSNSRRVPSTLYIQMEYCERRTLRDLILRNMQDEDIWRYVRQITEGLAHIHGHGIIHRDLKPDNVFIDVAGNPKIGDFGLATTGQYIILERGSGAKGQGSVDLTRSIGTALYVAPELQSSSSSAYNDKVDMYSLGIIFFEMSEAFGTAMERVTEIQQIRKKEHALPSAFRSHGDKVAQGQLIMRLISHKPSERPSSMELLRSDIPALKVEDETVRQALSTLADPRSPYHQKVMSALFAHDSMSTQRIKALAWEAKTPAISEDADRIHLKGVARAAMESVFKNHGAEETRRDGIFPRSDFYTNPNVVQMLDASGNLLQLPYDLTLSHARQLARHKSKLRCAYAFGVAYRDAFRGGPPRAIDEADFDIIDIHGEQSNAQDEAELIKVMDEIVSKVPFLETMVGINFHFNHSDLLDAILDHCRIPAAEHHPVKETLSKLGIQGWDWARIRSELRNQGLTDTTLDDLKSFDFRDVTGKALAKLGALLDGAAPRVRSRFIGAERHLREVLECNEIYKIGRKLYLAPLSCFNARFFEGGLLFQCVLERKTSRTVLAAGGRYDSLIRAHCLPEARQSKQGAVGICIGLDVIVSHLVKASSSQARGSFAKNNAGPEPQVPRRCDVAVVTVGSPALHIVGMKTVNVLWDNDIAAELAGADVDEHHYAFIVGLKHESSATARVTNTDSAKEADIPLTSLVSYLAQELRERAHDKTRRPLLRNPSSHHDGERQLANVHVLMARHGSKKSNKYHLVEMAQQRWADKLADLKNCHILAIEGRDDIVESIQSTTLGNAESWRDAMQKVQLNERQYMQEVKDTLASWRDKWAAGEGGRTAGVVNFRTGTCIYYDLGL